MMFSTLFALLPLIGLTSATPITKRQTHVLIESGRNPGQCLSISGGRIRFEASTPPENDTPVITLACAVASYWDIERGSGSVLVSGTDYALDIGLTPANNGGVKVYQSYPTAPQQTWYLTDDNRIAQTGGNQCLDQGDDGPQTYECTTGNTNQVWNVRFSEPSISSWSVGPITTQVSSWFIGPAVTPASSWSACPAQPTIVVSPAGPALAAPVVSSSGPAQATLIPSSAGPAKGTLISSSAYIGPRDAAPTPIA